MNIYIKKSVQQLDGYVPGEQPVDPRIIKLNTNENPYPPSPAVAGVLSNLDPGGLSKYPDPVCLKLRRRIAEIHGKDPGQVIVGNGSDELLALCIRAFVETGDPIGFFDPSYSLYPVLARIAEVRVNPVPLPEDFGWTRPPAGVGSLFFLANPNAPTGILFPEDEVRSFCDAIDGVVVIDEAYVDFASGHCMDLAGAIDNVLVLRTLSKSFSLAGIRLGYAVGSEELVQALYKIKDSYNVNALTQQVGLAALSDLDHMRANVERIRASRARASRALTERGWKVCPSEANFIWARPSENSAKNIFDQLQNKGILVRYFPGERTGEFLRITIGTDQEVDAFLASLDELETVK